MRNHITGILVAALASHATAQVIKIQETNPIRIDIICEKPQICEYN